jgi:hypothetical protein
VCVIASPNGRRFVDADALEVETGQPVRSVTMLVPADMPGPDEPGTDEQHVTRLPWRTAWQSVLEHPWPTV